MDENKNALSSSWLPHAEARSETIQLHLILKVVVICKLILTLKPDRVASTHVTFAQVSDIHLLLNLLKCETKLTAHNISNRTARTPAIAQFSFA
jgi:hypothetical protein